MSSNARHHRRCATALVGAAPSFGGGGGGTQGPPGANGSQGFQGGPGVGSQGFQGGDGGDGVQGFQGNDGNQGNQGNQGTPAEEATFTWELSTGLFVTSPRAPAGGALSMSLRPSLTITDPNTTAEATATFVMIGDSASASLTTLVAAPATYALVEFNTMPLSVTVNNNAQMARVAPRPIVVTRLAVEATFESLVVTPSTDVVDFVVEFALFRERILTTGNPSIYDGQVGSVLSWTFHYDNGAVDIDTIATTLPVYGFGNPKTVALAIALDPAVSPGDKVFLGVGVTPVSNSPGTIVTLAFTAVASIDYTD